MKHVEAADYFNVKLKQAASEDNVTQNPVEQGSAGSSGITMSSIWVSAVVGSLAGSLVGVALVAVGYKLYADRRQSVKQIIRFLGVSSIWTDSISAIDVMPMLYGKGWT